MPGREPRPVRRTPVRFTRVSRLRPEVWRPAPAANGKGSGSAAAGPPGRPRPARCSRRSVCRPRRHLGSALRCAPGSTRRPRPGTAARGRARAGPGRWPRRRQTQGRVTGRERRGGRHPHVPLLRDPGAGPVGPRPGPQGLDSRWGAVPTASAGGSRAASPGAIGVCPRTATVSRVRPPRHVPAPAVVIARVDVATASISCAAAGSRDGMKGSGEGPQHTTAVG